MLSLAWNDLRAQTVVNCWTKKEFGDGEVERDEDAIPIPMTCQNIKMKGF